MSNIVTRTLYGRDSRRMASRVGELLLKSGLITQEQLDKAQELQRQNGGLIGSHIVGLGCITEEALLDILSKQYGLPIVQLDDYDLSDQITNLIPHNLAMKHSLVPLVLKDETLTVAMADPSNILALNDIKFITGFDIHVVLAGADEIRGGIDSAYDNNI